MQHISSTAALEEATARLLAAAATLDDTGLDALGRDLQAVSALLVAQPVLRRTLSEATTSGQTRVGIVTRLLTGKIGDPSLHLLEFAVGQHWANGADLAEGIGRLGRTAMFLRAERIGELDEVEDQLFRFARIVDGSPRLSVVLDDPTAAPEAKAGLVRTLLAGKAHALTTELLTGLAVQPSGRSFSHDARELVSQAAQRRDKIVAVAVSAVPLSAGQTDRLTAALERIYHRKVIVHVEVDPVVMGGMKVTVGDEVIDGTVSGRLEALRSGLA